RQSPTGSWQPPASGTRCSTSWAATRPPHPIRERGGWRSCGSGSDWGPAVIGSGDSGDLIRRGRPGVAHPRAVVDLACVVVPVAVVLVRAVIADVRVIITAVVVVLLHVIALIAGNRAHIDGG